MQIIPLQSMPLDDKFNAIMRFSLYLGIIVAIINSDYRWLFLPIFTAIITILLTESNKNIQNRREAFLEDNNIDIVDNSVCTRSTVDNPFMNMMYGDDRKRPGTCNIFNPKIQQTIESNFNARLFRDVSDVYNKMSSQREFYTVPVTTATNDSIGFAEWRLGSGSSCKEGNGERCWTNMAQTRAGLW